MKITPLDIKKQEFAKKMRGFDRTEVNSFLEMVAEELENSIRENLELKEKLQRASDKLANYSKIESALQNTLVATQESAEQMKAAAAQNAELIVREANLRAGKIVDDAYDRLAEARREYANLRNQRAAFLVNFKSLLESQMKLLELMEKQADEANKTLVLKKKPEYSDSEVDRVVEQFKRDHTEGNQESRFGGRMAAEHIQQKPAEES